MGNFGAAGSHWRHVAGCWRSSTGDRGPTLKGGQIAHGLLRRSRHNIALLRRKLIGRKLVRRELVWRELVWRKLVRREVPLQRLLRIGTGREVLLVLQALSHPLEHILGQLTHLIHVALLLHSLGIPRNGVKCSLLRRESWNALVGCWSEPSGDGIVLPGSTFGAEHTVCWNLFTACAAVHDATPF